MNFKVIPNGGRQSDGSHRVLSRWTFQYEPAKDIVENHIEGRVLNACAGQTYIDHDGEVVRNDLNPDRDADYHYDVSEIADYFEPQSFDAVVFDPPFDQIQADDKYGSIHVGDICGAFDQFNKLVRPGGVVISFGWNSWGMGSHPAFERTHVYLLQRGAILRDVIVTVDKRTTMDVTAPTAVSAGDLQ